jgi:hypothetical protein
LRRGDRIAVGDGIATLDWLERLEDGRITIHFQGGRDTVTQDAINWPLMAVERKLFDQVRDCLAKIRIHV